VFSLACLLAFSVTLSAAGFDAQAYQKDVNYLASPELKGRATGSPELEKAGQFIASQFKSFGLKPVDGKNFELAFPAEIGVHLGNDNTMSFRDPAGKASLKQPADYTPFAFSTNGKFSGPVVFAGYGITAPEYKYDDYEGLDVKGKLVLLLRHEPQEMDEKSVFDGKKLTRHAEFLTKMLNAKGHGARGVILINDVSDHKDDKHKEDKLEKFGEMDGPRDAGVFFVQVKASTAERWLMDEGRDMKKLADEIDADLKPRSFALTKVNVELAVDVQRESKTVHNVAGYMAGQTDEYIVIGAHYDHLGLGDSHSLAPNLKGTIHPGADDNASGTAGVIELARYFSATYTGGKKPKRGILFMTFAGEELGLLGSSWYVNHPILPVEKASAMINLDMIGRIQQGRVFMSGAATGTTLQTLIESVKVPEGLNIDTSGRNSGTNMSDASDHASFVAKQIPSLFFFSGLHGDYHKPSDTPEKIDSADAVKLLAYVAEIADKISSAPDRPQFVKVARPTPGSSGGPSGGPGGDGGNRGYGPSFGSIPDFNEPPKGVRFADVRPDTPAAKAGLRAGDILIEFDGKQVGNLYDFTYALQSHKAGDLVPVKVLRGDQTIEAKVLLTERR
jgi:hypothetical protein